MASFLEQYWKLQRYADSQYKDAVVLVEKGSFMECYSLPGGLGRAERVAQVLNMIITKCNKNLPIGETNPNMVGFPKNAHDKNVPVMIACGMTIVWVEQVWDNWRKMVSGREITRVITPGTYMEHPPSEDGYHIGCVQTVTSPLLLSSGGGGGGDSKHYVAVMDTSVGTVETMRLDHDDDLVWFANVYNPREMLCVNGNDLVHELFNRIMYKKDAGPYNDKAYQSHLLDKVYPESAGNDLEPVFRTAVVCLLDFVNTCHPKALTRLTYPKEVWSTHMSLHNNAVGQLDLLRSDRGPGVLGTLNKTRTAMGRRLLARRLLRPMVNRVDMTDAYDEIDRFLRDDLWRSVQSALLCKIPDIERIMKRIDTDIANEHEIMSLHRSIRLIHDSVYVECDTSFIGAWDDAFDCDTMEFVPAHDTTLDRLRRVCENARHEVDTMVMNRFGQHAKLEFIKNEYQLVATTKKGELLRKQHKDVLQLTRVNASVVKLTGPEIDPYVDALSKAYIDEQEQHKKAFALWRTTLSRSFGHAVRVVSRAVATLDCACAKAECAVVFKQVRPCVCDSTESFVVAEELKHPLLENYVGNDCTLDASIGGILLYGINGAGKSCYSKSIAINVVMAQAGFFVHARSFRFAPFTKLFTRIQCDDNVYKGMSSFMVEMHELRSILRLADERSLVIGDELCKGTEDLSAVSLVGASIKWMSDQRVKYVFATHLHKLPTIDFVKNIPNVRIKHMKSEYNSQLGKLVFLRKLGDGQGDPLYGIEIARQILGVPQVANMAMLARQQLLTDTSTNHDKPKKSRYNKQIIVKECAHCKSTKSLHTHHIVPQQSFSKNDTLHMNKRDNLIVLCHRCHDDVHKGSLHLQMMDTVQGRLAVFR